MDRVRRQSLSFLLMLVVVSAQEDLKSCEVKTVSETGVTLWYNQPSAVFYQGEHERTYFAWVTSSGEVQLRFYDHDLAEFSERVTLHSWEKSDDHAAPSLHIITEGANKGRLVVAYSFHSSPLIVRYSRSPEDITHWSEETTIYESYASYPRLVTLPDRTLAVFFRSHPLEKASSSGWLAFMTSADDGANWGNYKKAIDFGNNAIVYAGPVAVQNGRLAVAWTVFDIERKRLKSELFVAYSDDSGQSWLNYDGTPFSPFINQTIEPIVLGEGLEQRRVWDTFLHPDGSLSVAHISYLEEYNFNTNRMAGYVTTWRQGEWVTQGVGGIAEVYYPSGLVFDPSDVNMVYVGSVQEGTSVIELRRAGKVQWELTDSDAYKGYTRPQVVKNFSPELKLTWLGVREYSNYKEFDTALLVLVCQY
jgi:hypothetical protein